MSRRVLLFLILALAVTPTVQALPDLIVTGIRVYEPERNITTPHDEALPESDEIVTEEEYVFYATIQNIGEGASPENVIHGVSFWVDGEAVNWSDDWEGPLAPGERRHLRANGGPAGIDTWTPMATGEREIMAWVDDIDRMEEADDTNNQFFITIEVGIGPPQWDVLYPIRFEAAAWTGEGFVVAGGDGRIFVSYGGLEWNEAAVLDDAYINSMSSIDGITVAVGRRGKIFVSTDLAHWNLVDAGIPVTLRSVTWINDRFWAVGEKGIILSSADGFDWRKESFGADADLIAIAGSEERMVAISRESVFRKDDDGAWKKGSFSIWGEFEDIAFAHDRFFIGGSLMVYGLYGDRPEATIWESSDGASWKHAVSSSAETMLFFQSTASGLIGVGNWSLVFTTDGDEWRHWHGAPPFTPTATAAGTDGWIVTGGRSSIAFHTYNDDGKWNTWNTVDLQPRPNITSLSSDGTRFWKIVDEDKLYYSDDALEWSLVSEEFEGFLWGMLIPEEFRLVFGSDGIWHSEDGDTWQLGQMAGSGAIHDIAYGNDIFIAARGDRPVLVSESGKSWREGPEITKGMNEITFGNGRFVGRGAGQQWYYSRDGEYWDRLHFEELSIFRHPGQLLSDFAFHLDRFFVRHRMDNTRHSNYGWRWDLTRNEPPHFYSVRTSLDGADWGTSGNWFGPEESAEPRAIPLSDGGLIFRFYADGQTYYSNQWGLWQTIRDFEKPVPQHLAVGEDYIVAAGRDVLVRSPRGDWPDRMQTKEIEEPLFFHQPEDVFGTAGEPFILRSRAGAGDRVSYQWYRDGETIEGATGRNLILTETQLSDEGDYWVVASNTQAETSSRKATVRFRYGGPGEPDLGYSPMRFPPFRGIGRVFAMPNAELLVGARHLDEFGGFIGIYEQVGSGFVSTPEGKVLSIRGQRIRRIDPEAREITDFGPVFNRELRSLAVDRDGTIYAGGGFLEVDAHAQAHLVRLLPDGSIDPSFSPDIDGTVERVAIDNEGRVLVFGTFEKVNQVERKRMARLLPDGTLDLTFVPEDPPAQADVGMKVDYRNRIVIGQSGGLRRWLPDGREDPDFNPPLFSVPILTYGAPAPPVTDFLMLDDGRIFVTGWVHDNELGRNLHGARLNEDGSIDRTHPGIPYLSDSGRSLSVTQQSDGKIIFAGAYWGQHRYYQRLESTFLRRLLPDRRPAYFPAWAEEAGVEQRRYADPGGHGISMLMRYALNLDAHRPQREHLPRPEVVSLNAGGAEEDFLGLTFTRYPDPVDLDYIVEVSEDLVEWMQVPEENLLSRRENPDGTETVTVLDWLPLGNEDTARRFMRLRVESLVGLPDLVVTDVQAYWGSTTRVSSFQPLPPSDDLVAGRKYSLHARIKNVGDGPTPSGVIHGVSFWVNGEVVGWNDGFSGALLPGQARNLRATGGPDGWDGWQPQEPGEYEIIAWVDDVDRIEEADDTNNQYWRELYVEPNDEE